MKLKQYEHQNATAALQAHHQAESSKAEAAAKAQREVERAAKLAEIREVNSRAGAGTPAANVRDEVDAQREAEREAREAERKPNLLTLDKAPPVLTTVSIEDSATGVRKVGSLASSLRSISLRRERTSAELGKRELKHQRTFAQSVKSLVNKGFRQAAPVRTRPKTGFYAVPLVKYVMRSMAHILFLCLYAEVLTHLHTAEELEALAPRLPKLTSAELALIVWSLTLGYEHRQRELRMRAFGLSTTMWLKSLVNWAHLVLGVAIGLRIFTLLPGFAAPQLYTAYQTLVSFDAVLMCTELFTFMWTSHAFGILAITLVQMMIDLSLFMVFFSVVIIVRRRPAARPPATPSGAHAHAHMHMHTCTHAHMHTCTHAHARGRWRMHMPCHTRGPLIAPLATPAAPSSPLWLRASIQGFALALLGLSETADKGEGSLVRMGGRALSSFTRRALGSASFPEQEEPPLLVDEPAVVELWQQPFWAMYGDIDLKELSKVPFGMPLMWVYVLIANVVLVNMLVAMFAETYQRIKQNAETEYRFQHHMYVFEYQHVVHRLPPPFNAPLLLWDALHACCRSTEERQRLARMEFETYEGDDELYGGLSVTGQRGGAPMSRKYVQRYLKTHTEVTNSTSQAAFVSHIERVVAEMEERLQHEFEHTHSALTLQKDEVASKFKYIAAALDRASKGETGLRASSNALAIKAAVRASPPPKVSPPKLPNNPLSDPQAMPAPRAQSQKSKPPSDRPKLSGKSGTAPAKV